MVYKVVIAFNVLHLLAPCLAQLTKRLLLLETGKPSPAQVGGNARCGAAAERVKNPVALVGRGKDHPDEQAQGLLGGVLAAGLLPTAYGWHAPHVGHLLAFVQLLHQVIVELVRRLLRLSCPDHKLGRIGEEAA